MTTHCSCGYVPGRPERTIARRSRSDVPHAPYAAVRAAQLRRGFLTRCACAHPARGLPAHVCSEVGRKSIAPNPCRRAERRPSWQAFSGRDSGGSGYGRGPQPADRAAVEARGGGRALLAAGPGRRSEVGLLAGRFRRGAVKGRRVARDPRLGGLRCALPSSSPGSQGTLEPSTSREPSTRSRISSPGLPAGVTRRAETA